MPQKVKASMEEKVVAVEDYLSGRKGISVICSELDIEKETFRGWVRLYESRGATGLIPAQRTKRYSKELKSQVSGEYLAGDGSYADLCRKYDISDTKIVRRWVKQYNSHVEFREPNTGGAIYMVKGRKTTLEERIEIVSYCIASNKDYGKTTQRYGVSYQQIYGWVRKYEKDGASGLADHRGKHKSEVSMSEIEKLHAQLKLQKAENLRLQMENELLKKLEALERGRDED